MDLKEINVLSSQMVRSLIYFVVIIITVWLVSPYIGPLILAAIVASIFVKIKPSMPKKLTNNKSLYAGISTVLTLLVIIIPMLLIIVLLGLEAFNFVGFVQKMLSSDGFTLLTNKLAGTEHAINNLLEPTHIQISIDGMRAYIGNSVQVFGQLIYNNAIAILSNLAGIMINSFFFLFITYFLVRDGEMIIEQFKSLLPFNKQETQNLVDAVEHVGQTVIMGSIVSSLIMGAIMTVVFWLFGFTSPMLWGLCIAFLALIPVLGTWIIYIPSVFFLYFSNSWWMALLFLITVIFIDSFLFYAVIRPRFLDARTQLYPLAIFLAILGGITLFGPIGIVYGPCIMALFITLMKHLALMKKG